MNWLAACTRHGRDRRPAPARRRHPAATRDDVEAAARRASRAEGGTVRIANKTDRVVRIAEYLAEQLGRPLTFASWCGERSAFFFNHVYGDKELFHLCWRKLGQEYAMPIAGHPHAVGHDVPA